MERVKIVRVTSNIKSPGGVPWTHTLSDLNILIGPNESGKSAVAEAVQLAVSGSAYGLFFRAAQVKSGSQLGQLGPRGEEIFAEVEYSDGSTSRWEMSEGGRPKKTGEVSTILPIAELRAALSGSATRARHFFAPLMLKPISREELEKLLPSKDLDLSIPLEKLLPDYGNDITPEDLIKVYKECGSWKRQSKAKAKAATELLSVLGNANQMDQEQENQMLADLCRAIQFGWLKKQFKASEDEAEQDALKSLALTIGNKATLKALPGSAQCWDSLRKMWNGETLHRSLTKARRQASNAETEAKEFESLENGLDVVMMMLLAKPITEYCRRVNKMLPKGDKFGVVHNLRDFRVFLKRGEVEHFALSGSTESRVLAAMGAALSTGLSSSMVILDDRMWDTKTLSKTMERLEQPHCQVILMSTFKPPGRARGEWNYVEISSKGYATEDEKTQEQNQSEPSGNPFEEASA